MILLAAYLSRVHVYEADQVEPGGGKITPFIVEFMYKRRVAEVLLDLCLVAIAYYAAYRLRFEGDQYRSNFQGFLNALPIVLGVQMVALVGMGVYRAVWHRFSLMDGVEIVKAVTVGTAAIAGIIFVMYRFVGYSRGVFVMYAALATILLMSARASFRLMGEFVRRRREGKRLVVYGAGENVPMVVSALLDGPVAYRLLGFVDDDPTHHGANIHGYRVLGGYDTLVTLINEGSVDSVVISLRLLSVDRQRELERLCTEHETTLSRLHVEFHDVVAS
jgi:FlaA1/EpsC-like NDP-sugar epimerase